MFKFFKNILYALPFGLKAADNEMLSQKASVNSDTVSTHQVVENHKLSLDLRRGEVTQEVEELRHRTYVVDRASQDYNYIGEGVAIKHKNDRTVNLNRIKLYQENKMQCNSIYKEFQRVDTEEYGEEQFSLTISYDSIPKHRLEKYCHSFSVKIKDGEYKFIMNFYNEPNKDDITSYTFIKELDYMSKNMSKDNDYKNLQFVQFVTYKAVGEYDLVKYTLYDLTLEEIEYKNDNRDCSVVFTFDYFHRDDLIEKYYSDSMQEKYDKKESKGLTLDLTNVERVRHCAQCGVEINVYDGDLTEETYGVPLCQKCLEKTLQLIK